MKYPILNNSAGFFKMKSFLRFLSVVCLSVILLTGLAVDAVAYGVDHYAAESRLNTGRWVRVSVTDEGMQFLSKSALASMGFSDPAKVKVYGYGAHTIDDKLTEDMPDDLPEIPVVRTGGGILFYGAALTSYGPNKSATSSLKYAHELNPYSTVSYYFLCENDDKDSPVAEVHDAGSFGLVTKKTFRERLLHEDDRYAIGVSGRELFGEDFRSVRTRSFPFSLDGNTGGDMGFLVKFAGQRNSNIRISINGKGANSTLSSRSDSSVPYAYFNVTGSAPVDATSVSFQIEYLPSGSSSSAAYLDYIELEYERHLTLSGNELRFYDTPVGPTAYEISGCDKDTRIWDVTNPGDIREVKFELNGDKGIFTVKTPGYREFVAFKPLASGKTPQQDEVVANQNLHALETPDMVIITLPEFRSHSEEIASIHEENDGMSVVVVTPQAIYNEFSSGSPDVGAFRKFLKMLYDRGMNESGKSKLGYCLLMGAATYDNRKISETVRNCGYDVLPIYQSAGLPGELGSYSTDDLIAMLDDEDRLRDISSDKMRIAVGRIPARSVSDADNAVKKIRAYIEDLELGSWRNNVMLIADDQNSAAHLDQSEKAYSVIMENGGEGLKFDKVYLDAYNRVSSPLGLTFPDARNKMLELWKDGVMFINYIGHGSPRTWTHENLLTWSDINSMVNRRLPFLYAATCEFARWDDDMASGAEVMLFNPKGGVIAMICPSRTVYISNNGVLTEKTARFFFSRDEEGRGPRMGDIMKDGKNAMTSDDSNKLRYCMLGDPALRLKLPTGNSVIDKIGDADLTGSVEGEDEVVLHALDNKEISGAVLTSSGEVDESFNGIIEFTLMDASTVVETNGWEDENGNNGKISYYNDRKSRLSTGRTRVTDGKWSTRLFLPKDINNNTAPAQLLTYAYDAESGKEANGSNENIYVYGYSTSTGEDGEEGPEITSFLLNNGDFKPGDMVHPSPLVFASFKDAQGINVSDTGIGHQMTLTLDSKTYYDDISQYYSPDLDDPTAGAITYPLADLDAGEHTLTLTVWDNANNSSSQTITFKVGVNMNPSILDVNARLDTASDKVVFTIKTDMSTEEIESGIEIFSLNGDKVWESFDNAAGVDNGVETLDWNLCDMAGRRVSRGIYIYRATVVTKEGRQTSKSKKIAVGGVVSK